MMQDLSEIKNVQNKANESNPCLFSLSTDDIEGGKFTRKRKLENQKRHKRRRFSMRNKNIEKTKYSKRHKKPHRFPVDTRIKIYPYARDKSKPKYGNSY